MPYDPDIHHRRSIRLSDYDYSLGGLYFVTICTHGQISLFGDVIDGCMFPNEAGKMVERWYKECEMHFEGLRCLEYIVMPNHFHCIFLLVGADRCVCPNASAPLGGHAGPPLHRVLQWFKTMTTNEYIRRVKSGDFPAFRVRLWQRNYYEHIIRSQHSYDEIVEYIRNNPCQWYHDSLNHIS